MADEIWAQSQDEIFTALDTSTGGLSGADAQDRKARYGLNEIKAVKKTPLIFKFLANLYDLFAILLWVAAALAFISGEPQLGWVIIAVIFINSGFSFSQEFKAEKAIEALSKLIPAKARVIRDNERQEILATDLVPGDIVLLEEGDKVSADARVIEEHELRTDNATLTGESEPVRRTSDPFIETDITLTHVPNLVFAGTSVAYGRGRGVVYATGMSTEFGKIAAMTQAVAPEASPLQKQMAVAAKTVAVLAVGLGFVLFLVGSQIAALDPAQSLTFAIGMIIANIPEGLLPTVTLALAVGVQRLVKRNALVKKLSSVETLGSTNVICTDKTGTLTQNEMTVREIWSDFNIYRISGVGYEPTGEVIGEAGDSPDKAPARDRLDELMKTAYFCNNARLLSPDAENRKWRILGDPTEGAMLVAAEKWGLPPDVKEKLRQYELPFDSRRKRMTAVYGERGGLVAYVKGAPTTILDLSQTIRTKEGVRPMTGEDRREIVAANDRFARAALRVIALAQVDLPADQADITPEEVEKNLTFLGLMAMMDPPRPEVEAAISECRAAGIRVIMITGDYGLTAESIARRIGMVSTDSLDIINGVDLEGMADGELKEKLLHRQVLFARVSPEHKMRVAGTLKELGQVVAMTGDGVNDAPALKRADIGVAMGITGTDVAKEAAEMIITDDNFATIVDAVEQGRVVFDNMQKFVTYIFAHLTPQIVPFILFVIFQGMGFPLGITALQILAIDLGTETLPALALGAEPPEPGVMDRPPRSQKEGLLSKRILLRAYVWLGSIEAILVTAAFLWVLLRGGWVPGTPDISVPGNPLYGLYLEATTMTFLGIVAAQVGTVFASRTHRASVFQVGFFSNRLVLLGIAFELVLAAVLLYVPFLADFFGMAPLGLLDWVVVLSFAPVIFLADEARKVLVRRNGNE
jgi:P-type Ca2+ transporter type 2C